jgi:hypothetical protein
MIYRALYAIRHAVLSYRVNVTRYRIEEFARVVERERAGLLQEEREMTARLVALRSERASRVARGVPA